MNALTIVDSDVLIDAAQKIEAAIDCLARIENQSVLAVSVITQMELIVGCRNKAELRHTEHFLQRFRVIKLNETMCGTALELVREYRLSHGLLIPDALIAATAIVLNEPFVTKNQRDYRFIPRLHLLSYPGLNDQ